jgi:hypothetical protein
MFQLISQDDLEFAQNMGLISHWFLCNLQAIQKDLVKSRNYQMNHFLVALSSSTSYNVGLPSTDHSKDQNSSFQPTIQFGLASSRSIQHLSSSSNVVGRDKV